MLDTLRFLPAVDRVIGRLTVASVGIHENVLGSALLGKREPTSVYTPQAYPIEIKCCFLPNGFSVPCRMNSGSAIKKITRGGHVLSECI